MTDWKLRIYHSSPLLVRNLLASMRGYQLRRWRYGADTEDLVAQAIEREHWSSEQWQTYQQEQLAYVLNRAATKVPYYRDQWMERRRKGDESSWEYLENWPILSKDALRANPRAFVAEDQNINVMVHEHTSGTTGKPLDLWWSLQTVRDYYAIFEARLRRWNGVTYHDRWGIMGGQLITPVEQKKPPFWVWNAAMNQLYLSSYHLAPAYLPFYVEALKRYQVRYIYAYSSSIYSLAQEIVRANIRDVPPLAVIFTNAEPLFEHQRQVITQAFGCPVRETYGMSEIVAGACECEAGSLHLWPEVGLVEILEHDQPVPHGQPGEIIGTGLLNADMPLIRYRVGDRGWLTPTSQTACACGRHLPRLGGIEGRLDDMVYTSDGRRVGRLDPVFKSTLPIREAQIIQESLIHFRVLIVPDAAYTPADGASIVERLTDRVGDVRVTLEQVESIPRTSNGKFRAVLCNLSPEERQRLDSHAQ